MLAQLRVHGCDVLPHLGQEPQDLVIADPVSDLPTRVRHVVRVGLGLVPAGALRAGAAHALLVDLEQGGDGCGLLAGQWDVSTRALRRWAKAGRARREHGRYFMPDIRDAIDEELRGA